MAVEKKILRNRPFQGANAQYNFEDDNNIGIDPLGKLDVESDLYTTSIGNETNEYNILGTGMFGQGRFLFKQINFGYRNLPDGSDNFDFRIGFFDGEQFPEVVERFQISEEGFLNYYNVTTDETIEWSNYQGVAHADDYFNEIIDGRMRAGRSGVDLIGGFVNESTAEALVSRFTMGSGYGFNSGEGGTNLLTLTHYYDGGNQVWNGYSNQGVDEGLSPGQVDADGTTAFLAFQYFPYMTDFGGYDYYDIFFSPLEDGNTLLFKENFEANEVSANENSYATPKQWYNSDNLSDTQTRINTTAFYNSMSSTIMTDDEKQNQNPKDSFYIMVHQNSENNNNNPREETFVIFRIPKYVFADAWNDPGTAKRVVFTRDGIDMATPSTYFDPYDINNNNYYSFPCPINFREGGPENEPAIEFHNSDPNSNGSDVCAEFYIQKYPTDNVSLNENTLPFYKAGGVVDENNLLGFSPFNIVTYSIGNMGTEIPEEERGLNDFRPLTNVYSSQEMDLQSYYLDELDRNQTSAPNEINLSFDFAKNKNLFTPEELDLTNSDEWNQTISLKAFVVNWDWKEGESETWEDIVRDFPKTEPELQLKRNQDNTYYFVDVPEEQLTHFYQTAGFKIIKAIVVSYYDYENNYINLLRWKLLTIKINLSVDTVYLEDFGDIGGFDYTFIPWPETTTVIGGLSEESIYVNTLESLVKQNKFRQDEILDKTLALNALQNDELGNYFGKSDISQVRYFKDGSYDMNKLLMIQDDKLLYDDNADEIIQLSEFHPYYDYEYWDGETFNTTYPQESCVGTLFINDNMNQELRQNILIEMNMDEIDERTIRDSSGNGYKGLILGDYAVKKDSKEIRVRRETETVLPETDTEEKAF